MGFFRQAATLWNGDVKCDWCGRYIKNIDDSGLFGSAGALVGRAIAGTTKQFCSAQCKAAYKAEHQDEMNEDEDTEEAEDKIRTEPKSAGGGILGMVGATFKGAGETMLSDIRSQNQAKSDRQSRLKEVPQIQFSGTSDEIQNQLNALFSEISGLNIGFAGTPEEKALYKAIYEKLEFGIMRLNSAGASVEANFFKQKFDKLKVLK